jgi:hypothetical protein
MRRATPLGQEQNAPADARETHPNPASEPPPSPDKQVQADEQAQSAHSLSVVRGGAAGEQSRPSSGEHRRRRTPARAVIQASDPERLRRALEAMREMNKLTRRRTEEMRKLSTLSRDLAQHMEAFGSVIGGLKIGPQRNSAG